MTTKTTPGGTTVTLKESEYGDQEIWLDHPDAPADLRDLVVGRIIDGGFQTPVLSRPIAMSPDSLRAIADLIEEN